MNVTNASDRLDPRNETDPLIILIGICLTTSYAQEYSKIADDVLEVSECLGYVIYDHERRPRWIHFRETLAEDYRFWLVANENKSSHSDGVHRRDRYPDYTKVIDTFIEKLGTKPPQPRLDPEQIVSLTAAVLDAFYSLEAFKEYNKLLSSSVLTTDLLSVSEETQGRVKELLEAHSHDPVEGRDAGHAAKKKADCVPRAAA